MNPLSREYSMLLVGSVLVAAAALAGCGAQPPANPDATSSASDETLGTIEQGLAWQCQSTLDQMAGDTGRGGQPFPPEVAPYPCCRWQADCPPGMQCEELGSVYGRFGECRMASQSSGHANDSVSCRTVNADRWLNWTLNAWKQNGTCFGGAGAWAQYTFQTKDGFGKIIDWGSANCQCGSKECRFHSDKDNIDYVTVSLGSTWKIKQALGNWGAEWACNPFFITD